MRIALLACLFTLAVASGAEASVRSFTVPDTPWGAADYDGLQAGTDQPDLTSLPTFHAVYLYPKDGVNRFARFAAMFQRDARRASDAFETTVGHRLRWDDRRSADGRVLLDITVLRSKYTTAQLGGSNQFSDARNSVSAQLANPNKKYVTWLDAPSKYCGQSDGVGGTVRAASNTANKTTYTAVYRYYDPANPQGGFCSPLTHELSHSMGAVLNVAPHSDGTSHCNDGGNDILCSNSTAAVPYDASKGFVIDFNDDDYWDPAADPYSDSTAKLGWWTINLSRFLCPPVPGTSPVVADCSKPNNPIY